MECVLAAVSDVFRCFQTMTVHSLSLFRCDQKHSDPLGCVQTQVVVSFSRAKTHSDVFRFIEMHSDVKHFRCLNLVAKQCVLRCLQMLSENRKNHFSF